MAKIRPRSFKGTRDFTPREMIPREEIISSIKSVFKLYGFNPLETPALEMLEVLSGKYGDEGEKLIYKLDYKNDRPKDRVALRYDLTVPLARVIANHPEWPTPFKRYQVQPVWRADQPQVRQGRFREFYQCDVDTIGAPEGLADAEIIALTAEMVKRLGFSEGDRKAVVQVNHRKVLEALCEYAGLEVEKLAEFTRALDKMDKIGRDGVKEELKKIDVTEEAFGKLEELFDLEGENRERMAVICEKLSDLPAAIDGLDGLEKIFGYLEALDVPEDAIHFNAHLARGLDYYTGAVYETILPAHPHIGSLTGGGRYDKLIGLYSGQDLPAVGTTIGLDRMFAAMEQLGMVEANLMTVSKVLFVAYSEEETTAALKAVRMFRNAGVACEIFPTIGKLKKPFNYANKQNIPFVGVIGPDEAIDPENLKVSLKTLAEGSQETVSISEAIERVKSSGKE